MLVLPPIDGFCERIDEEIGTAPPASPPHHASRHDRSVAPTVGIVRRTLRFRHEVWIWTGAQRHLAPGHGRLFGHDALQKQLLFRSIEFASLAHEPFRDLPTVHRLRGAVPHSVVLPRRRGHHDVRDVSYRRFAGQLRREVNSNVAHVGVDYQPPRRVRSIPRLLQCGASLVVVIIDGSDAAAQRPRRLSSSCRAIVTLAVVAVVGRRRRRRRRRDHGHGDDEGPAESEHGR
mmetsp:Transcript_35661/g.76143  ORF Transcript_35661/g.76143 Transcript_35661/m.76143 type:complete len:232 (+) Transcript_35661:469-1164(+)